MAKSKVPKKAIGIGVGGIMAIVVVVTFVPLTAIGFTPEQDLEDFIDQTIEEAIEIAEDDIAFELPVCSPNCFSETEIEIENPTIIETILDPIEEGIQEPDPEVIINEEQKEIVVKEAIVEPEPELTIQPTVEIVSNFVKIDNTGERFESSTNFNVPLAQLFVEDTTNIDFDQGFIENELMIKTDQSTNIELTGFLDIFIDNKTILTNPISIEVDGISDEDGMISINFLSPTGIPSNTFLFQFNDHTDKFPISGLTKIEYKLSDVSVNIGDFSYSLSSETIFEMDIFTDSNLILIMDEEGGKVRVLPTDTTLTISSSARNWSYKNGRGCKVIFGKQTCGSYITAKTGIQAPVMGSGEVFHITKTGQIESIAIYPATSKGGCTFTNLGSRCQSVPKLNIIIERDEIYKIDFKSPNGSVMFKTPMTKTSYSFYCKNLGDTNTPNIFCNYNDPATKDALLATLEQP